MSVKMNPIKGNGRLARSVKEDVRERMFEHWRTHGHNLTDTGKAFNLSYQTAFRISRADKWEERQNKIMQELRDKQDKQIVKEELKRADLVRACFKEEIKAFLKKAERGELNGSLQNIVTAARYLDEIEGELPPANQPAQVDVNLQLYLTPSPATPEEARDRRQTLAEILSDSDFGG